MNRKDDSGKFDSKSAENSEEKETVEKTSSEQDKKICKDSEFDKLIEGKSIWIVVEKFLLPFQLAFGLAFLLYILFPDLIGKIGSLFVVYFFSPAGMEIGVAFGILEPPIGLGLDPFLVVSFMLVIDSLTAMFLIWNFDYTRCIPGIGRLVKWVQGKAEKKIQKSKRFERGSFVGIIIFVLIPLYGTGAIFGGILGKLLKMNPWKHFIAIFIGSIIRLCVMALFAVSVFNFFGW